MTKETYYMTKETYYMTKETYTIRISPARAAMLQLNLNPKP